MPRKLLLCYSILTVVPTWKVLCQAPKACSEEIGCYYGKLMDGYQTEEFEAFLGIPYAFPPNRFEPSVLYKSTKEHEAKKVIPDCLQKNYLVQRRPISGSEDCLYLNVYRPTNRTHLYPVLVYIHGGGFFSGSGSSVFVGPEYIMDRGEIILVTITYRLGAFGFLTTNDEHLPGNLGLKDQVVALNWVYDNIEAFGGDERRIIIFGQSAGAVSVHMHMLSRLSYGLFTGVIAMSGTANVPFAIDENPEYTARQTAKHCNIQNWDTLSTADLAKALKRVNKLVLLNAGDKLKHWDVDNLVNYRPIVEKPGPTAFLSQHPDEILRTGNYHAVPIMFGRVPNEGGVRVIAIMESEKLRHKFNNDFYNLMGKFLEFPSKFNSSQVEYKVQQVVIEYFRGVSNLNNATRQAFVDLVTDRRFYQPLFNVVKFHVNAINTNRHPAYFYKFNFQGPFSYSSLYAGGVPKHDYGVVHHDDTLYMFRSPLVFPDYGKNSSDAGVIRQFVDSFVNFAHFRRPKVNLRFEKCNRDTFMNTPMTMCDYHEFTKDPSNGALQIRLGKDFDIRRMQFWDDILEDNYIPKFI